MLTLHVGVYAPVAVLTIYTEYRRKWYEGRRGESATTIFGSGVPTMYKVSKEVGYEPEYPRGALFRVDGAVAMQCGGRRG